jgi:hypothetical protein
MAATLDTLREQQIKSPVKLTAGVADLLTRLGVKLSSSYRRYFSGYQINFTHVYRRVRVGMRMTRNNIRDLYFRFAAVHASGCFPGIGVIVPMYNPAADPYGLCSPIHE